MTVAERPDDADGARRPRRRSTAACAARVGELFARVRAAALGGARWIVVATPLGGGFGRTLNGEPPARLAGGVAGLVKTVAKEYPDRHVRAVDLHVGREPAALAAHLLAELLAGDRLVEVGYDGAHAPRARAGRRRAGTAPPASTLDSDSVVLLTGGARGITARIGARARPALPLPARARRPLAGPRPTSEPGRARRRDRRAPRCARLLARRGGHSTPAEIEAAVRAHPRRARDPRDARPRCARPAPTCATTRSTSATPTRSARLIDDVYAAPRPPRRRRPRRRRARGQAAPRQDAGVVRARVRHQGRTARARSPSALRTDVALRRVLPQRLGRVRQPRPGRLRRRQRRARQARRRRSTGRARRARGRRSTGDRGRTAAWSRPSSRASTRAAASASSTPDDGVARLLRRAARRRARRPGDPDRGEPVAMRCERARRRLAGPATSTALTGRGRRHRRDGVRLPGAPRPRALLGATSRAASTRSPTCRRRAGTRCSTTRRSQAPDRFYCRRGGFVDELADFDPLALRHHAGRGRAAPSPTSCSRSQVAARALADAGYARRRAARATASRVILGRGGYLGAGDGAARPARAHGAQQLVDHASPSSCPSLDAGAARRA